MKITIYKRFSTIESVVQTNADGDELELIEGVDYEVIDDYDDEPEDEADLDDWEENLDFNWLDDDEDDD